MDSGDQVTRERAGMAPLLAMRLSMRRVRDVLLVLGLAGALVVAALLEGRSGGVGLPTLVGLSLGVTLPLLWRRRLPLTAAGLAAGVALAGGSVLGWPGRLVAMAAWCAAAYYRPVRPGPMLAAWAAWMVAYVVTGSPAVVDAERPESPGVTVVVDLVVLSLVPMAVGYALRLRREKAHQLARVHRAEAARAAAEDHARLAREVHDSVGHHLTAIRLQATAARRALGGTPELADQALGTVAELAAAALGEVRELVRSAREEGTGAGLADVEALAARLSGPSLLITVRRTGDPVPLPPAVDHTAYRVVQEALTNAVRHARASEVEVWLRQRRDRLRIEVADNGPARPPAPAAAGGPVGEPAGVTPAGDPAPVAEAGDAEGQGIRGIRERVRELGGIVSIGPRQPNGWLIEAELPIAGRSR